MLVSELHLFSRDARILGWVTLATKTLASHSGFMLAQWAFLCCPWTWKFLPAPLIQKKTPELNVFWSVKLTRFFPLHCMTCIAGILIGDRKQIFMQNAPLHVFVSRLNSPPSTSHILEWCRQELLLFVSREMPTWRFWFLKRDEMHLAQQLQVSKWVESTHRNVNVHMQGKRNIHICMWRDTLLKIPFCYVFEDKRSKPFFGKNGIYPSKRKTQWNTTQPNKRQPQNSPSHFASRPFLAGGMNWSGTTQGALCKSSWPQETQNICCAVGLHHWMRKTFNSWNHHPAQSFYFSVDFCWNSLQKCKASDTKTVLFIPEGWEGTNARTLSGKTVKDGCSLDSVLPLSQSAVHLFFFFLNVTPLRSVIPLIFPFNYLPVTSHLSVFRSHNKLFLGTNYLNCTVQCG